ncbi:MAG: energy-coupling factor ABC transporter permease [Methanomicrobiales archaeon]|nr:energy-coupling factor ABC transporter permease [Methanomicrobiales archaeon]
MAHIHLSDGSFTLPWAMFWWVCALFVLGGALILFRRRRGGAYELKAIALASFLTAALFAIFQLEIPVLGGIHLNLTPFVGILAGPVMGCLVLFIVNILSAAVGHGGWSLIGANLLVNFTELGTAYIIWRWMRDLALNVAIRGGAAAFMALLLGNFVMIAIIMISGVQGQVVEFGELLLVGIGNLVAAVVESIVTGLILAYILKARPDLLDAPARR